MAIEIQLEKLRVVEAMNARDLLVQKLSDAYTSVREKTELIDRLQQALNTATNTSHTTYSTTDPQSWGQAPEMLQTQATDLEALIQDLSIGSRNTIGPPPKYEEEDGRVGDDISLFTHILTTWTSLLLFPMHRLFQLKRLHLLSAPQRYQDLRTRRG